MKEYMLVRLMYALQALALPADAQLSMLPDFVCKGDELALEFDNWFKTVMGNDKGDLSEDQRARLREINQLLSEMSGSQHAEKWTDEAVRSRIEWTNLRTMASGALEAFGWKIAEPPFGFGNAYVGQ